MKTHILVKDPKFIGIGDYLDLDRYISLVPGGRSSIIEEFRQKILTKPGKNLDKSALIKRSLLHQKLTRQFMPQNQSQTSLVSGESGGSQRAILLWENVGKIHRSYKRVTFAFVPGLKTDE